MFSILDK